MSKVNEAEQNLVNICTEFDDFMQFLDVCERFYNRYMNKTYLTSRTKFFDAYAKMREAIYEYHSNEVRDLMMFITANSDENSPAKQYSRKKFFETFIDEPDRYAIMQYLDRYGRHSTYTTESMNQFKADLQEAWKEMPHGDIGTNTGEDS